MEEDKVKSGLKFLKSLCSAPFLKLECHIFGNCVCFYIILLIFIIVQGIQPFYESRFVIRMLYLHFVLGLSEYSSITFHYKYRTEFPDIISQVYLVFNMIFIFVREMKLMSLLFLITLKILPR